jgi:ADP-heptose:LPS heptosyltransferase
MKILVIRFSSIGDIVLTTPVFRCIKEQLPGAEIHFLTKEKFKPVTENNPRIDRFFYYNRNLSELKRRLRKEKYDYVIDLHKNFRSYLVRWALRRKTYSYHKLTFQKFLLTKLGINVMPAKHIVTRNLEAVKGLGVVDDGLGLEYFIGSADVVDRNELPGFCRNGYVAIVIGASYFTKKLPVHKLKELCSGLPHAIILLGGKEDWEEGEAVALADPGMIFNACGKFTLNQSADLLRKADLVISHDTGLQYIACAFEKPVLAVWGGTSPKLDVEPYYGKNDRPGNSFRFQNFIVPGLPCQPCSRYGTKRCPKGHFKCMELQDIAFLQQIAGMILRSK